MSLGDANSKLETAQATTCRLLVEKHGGDESMVDLGVAPSNESGDDIPLARLLEAESDIKHDDPK